MDFIEEWNQAIENDSYWQFEELIEEDPELAEYLLDMVRAIAEGRKTQTRRVIKPQPPEGDVFSWFAPEIKEGKAPEGLYVSDDDGLRFLQKPRYQIGETVYIKENYYSPARSANYFIEIIDVRAERLQKITEANAKCEGASLKYDLFPTDIVSWKDYRTAFKKLWNSINKDYHWESNPWVWVYTFRLSKNVLEER